MSQERNARRLVAYLRREALRNECTGKPLRAKQLLAKAADVERWAVAHVRDFREQQERAS